MRAKTAFMALLALCITMTSCGASGDAVMKNGEIFVLKGAVRVVGNEPFSRLVLTVQPPDGCGRPTDHVVKGPLARELQSRLQGKVVTLECRRCEESARDLLPCIEPVKIVGVE